MYGEPNNLPAIAEDRLGYDPGRTYVVEENFAKEDSNKVDRSTGGGDVSAARYRAALRSTKAQLERIRRQERFAILVAVATLLAGGVTATVAVAVNAASSSSTGAVLTTLISSAIALVSAIVGYYFGNNPPQSVEVAEDDGLPLDLDPSYQVVSAVRRVEEAAARATGSSDRPSTVTRLIPELLRRGLWNEDDVQIFRAALRVRNHVVHGLVLDESESQLAATVRELDSLYNKLA